MQLRSHGEKARPRARRCRRRRERLDRDVGDAEEDACGGAEHRAVVLVVCRAFGHHQEGANDKERGFERDHRGQRVARKRRRGCQRHARGAPGRPRCSRRRPTGAYRASSRSTAPRARRGTRARRRSRPGRPTAAQLPGRPRGRPTRRPRRPSDREPLRAEQALRAGNRMVQVYFGGRTGAPVLKQEAEVRRESADEGKKYAE